jgi:hypothetical protein
VTRCAIPNGYALIEHNPEGSDDMVQILAATFKDGVFKPDERPALSDSARVRLVVETIDGNESAQRDESWATLQHLWNTSNINSGGDRLTREQLHERR